VANATAAPAALWTKARRDVDLSLLDEEDAGARAETLDTRTPIRKSTARSRRVMIAVCE